MIFKANPKELYKKIFEIIYLLSYFVVSIIMFSSSSSESIWIFIIVPFCFIVLFIKIRKLINDNKKVTLELEESNLIYYNFSSKVSKHDIKEIKLHYGLTTTYALLIPKNQESVNWWNLLKKTFCTYAWNIYDNKFR